jgi:NADPH:quinone reductase-like Zn-dependent oxidoreductase
MKACVCENYGPPEVLQLKEVEKPVPGDKDLLIRVRATTVNAADLNIRGLVHVPQGMVFMAKLMLGVRKPKISIQGSVIAGVVEEVGNDIQSFKPGDRVFCTGERLGGYGEYACYPETGAMMTMPHNLSFEEAATVPYGALTALYFLRDKAKVSAGQKVLVRGASGGVGVYAVQFALYFGAEVTGVCSTANLEFVKSLGAHKVIDYTKEDVLESGGKYDIIFDIVVGKTSFKHYKKILNPKGYYLAVAGGLNDMLNMIWTSVRGGRKVIFGGGTACETKENILFIKELIESDTLKAVLDKTFPFEQMVEAHRYVESGAKRGSIAVRLI